MNVDSGAIDPNAEATQGTNDSSASNGSGEDHEQVSNDQQMTDAHDESATCWQIFWDLYKECEPFNKGKGVYLYSLRNLLLSCLTARKWYPIAADAH